MKYECDCGMPSFTLTPCVHIIAAAEMVREKCPFTKFVDPIYHVETLRKQFPASLEFKLPSTAVINDIASREGYIQLKQPVERVRRKGRPKKGDSRPRAPGCLEEPNVEKKAARFCGACGESGHDRRTCPAEREKKAREEAALEAAKKTGEKVDGEEVLERRAALTLALALILRITLV